MAGKVYDVVKETLELDPRTRNDDKRLIWEVWARTGGRSRYRGCITYEDFLLAITPETITRARRAVQKQHPHLASNRVTQQVKDKKEATKGTFIYREEY